MNFRKILALLPFLSVTLWAASPAADKLTLPEEIFPQLDAILKKAVEQSPRMLNQALSLEIAENSRIEARAGILPSVAGSYRYFKTKDKRGDRTDTLDVDKSYYDFSVTQPLFFWGERINTKRIGEIQKKIAEGNYQEAYRILSQEIRGQYLGLVVKKTGLKRIQLANKFSQDTRNLAEERLRQNVTSEAEIFSVRVSADRSQIEMERADYDFEASKKNFSRLVGQTITDADIADEVPRVTYAQKELDILLAEFLSQADPHNIQAELLRNQIAIDRLSYANQKTRLRPKISLNAGINQDEQSYTINVAEKYSVQSVYGGVSVWWPIFDGFASRSGKRSALARLRISENQYKVVSDQLAADAQSQAKTLNFSARHMSIAERVLISAEGGYQVRQAEFARGVVSETQVTQDHLAYYDALIGAFNARCDYLMKVGEFLGLVSEDPILANAPLKK